MTLFRKKSPNTPCSCGSSCTPKGSSAAPLPTAAARVIVLGSGCAKCRALEEAARAALTELGRDDLVEHITDFSQVAAYGVMTTPARVIDGKVVAQGQVLKKDEIKMLLK